MKALQISLILLTLLAVVANLLFTMGIIGGTGGEYKAYTAQQMDELGFRKLAEANGIEVGEDGKIKFPREMGEKLLKANMLPFTVMEIEKEGWKLVTVTSDNHYLFRK